MLYLDLTLPSPAENLALDEALLDEADAAGGPGEVLRIWEPQAPLVVIGRSSQPQVEVRGDACRRLGIPVFRRASGGLAIVTGPGCLMYAVVLSHELRPCLRSLTAAHQFVLGRLSKALGALVPGVACRGTSDLVLGECKFSGNSLRAKRHHLLYHGTLLYRFPLPLIGECLAMPPREPGYRNGRPHEQFVTNLPVEAETIRRALIDAWGASGPLVAWPQERTQRLVAERYGRREWNGL